MERLEKKFLKKLQIPVCKLITPFPLTPLPPTLAKMIQQAWHTRFSCSVLFKLMKTRKLLLLLLAIYPDSDDSNQGKDLD